MLLVCEWSLLCHSSLRGIVLWGKKKNSPSHHCHPHHHLLTFFLFASVMALAEIMFAVPFHSIMHLHACTANGQNKQKISTYANTLKTIQQNRLRSLMFRLSQEKKCFAPIRRKHHLHSLPDANHWPYTHTFIHHTHIVHALQLLLASKSLNLTWLPLF